MLTKKGKLNFIMIGLIIFTAIILIGSQAVQAQDWETWQPQNLPWLYWSSLISPMDSLAGLPTPLVSSLNNDPLLQIEPALSWSPLSINFPYIPYNTTVTFNNNPLFFNVYNGINLWTPSYPIAPLKGLDTPLNLLIDFSSPSYSISYNMENGDSTGTAPSLPDYGILDVGPRIRELSPTDGTVLMDGLEEIYANATASSADPPEFYGVGDIMLSLWLDNTMGLWYLALFEVRAIGEHIEVWVMTELDFLPGDPRNPVDISDEQIEYFIEQFDNNIWPKSISFFGMPDFHDGSNALPPFVGCYDPEGRVIAMISNIGDEHYYDPDATIFIHGVYWTGFDYWLDRNVVSIDAYDWDNRLGPNDSPWRGPDPDKWREYAFDSTLAHEFQHLLHWDYDPDEELFVNEGCSMFAQSYVCGYGHSWRHLEEPEGLAVFPENSLVVWEDQGWPEILADYGLAYLWTLNLYEHFGEDFIKAMFHNPDNGITGINSTLASLGHDETFADIYHNFAVSLVTDPGHKGGGAFGFKEIDFSVNVDTPEAYDTPGAPPWGTDFIKIGNPKDIAGISFNGDDFLIQDTPWTSVYIPWLDEYFLYSGMGDLMDNWLIVPLDLTGVSSATLTLDHYYDMEDYWDFGFVQVSTDGGHTWTSLWDNEGLMTDITDPDAHPKVKANVPGFTSWSGSFVTSTFDLSPYAGQNIHLAFRYITDWFYYYEGWYIDEISVMGDGTSIFYNDGSSIDPFMDISQLVVSIYYDFTVTLIGASTKKGEDKFQVVPIDLERDSEEGGRDNLSKILSESDYAVMLVTFDAPEGFTEYADYTYEVIYNTTAKDSMPPRASSDKLNKLME